MSLSLHWVRQEKCWHTFKSREARPGLNSFPEKNLEPVYWQHCMSRPGAHTLSETSQKQISHEIQNTRLTETMSRRVAAGTGEGRGTENWEDNAMWSDRKNSQARGIISRDLLLSRLGFVWGLFLGLGCCWLFCFALFANSGIG